MEPDYFHAMYAADPDPWGFRSRWYERRKYAITLAALPRARYRSTFEPGCSIGVLTEQLARRTERLLACDLVPAAVDQARVRLAASGSGAEVEVRRWDLRDPWPQESFDLIVVSEVLYYLDANEAEAFMRSVSEHLDEDGHVVVCHWRPVVPEYPLTGDRAQHIARSTAGLARMGGYEDDDFCLDVLGREGRLSVARGEGLS